MGKILIAVDNELNARILTEILCIEGYETIVVNTGERAFNLFSSSDIDEISVILIDIQMQRVDGWSVARRIRKLDREDAGKVHIFAYADPQFKGDFGYAREMGLDLFLSDPINVDELLLNIEENVS